MAQPLPDPRARRQETAMLLGLALSPPTRPVDAVIARLREPDAAPWLSDLLAELARSDLSLSSRFEEQAVPPLRAIQAAADRARVAAADARTIDVVWRATAQYYWLIAAAAAHHSVNLTSLTPDETAAVLIDLADACDPRHASLLLRAATALVDPA